MKDVIELVRADVEDAELLHKLQIEAFMPLYERYHDDTTSPAKETLEKIAEKIVEPYSEFYIIRFEGVNVGGIRIRHHEGKTVLKNASWISPVFVIPAFQNKGIAGKVLQIVFGLYPKMTTWRLAAIKQETGSCCLYEKCGFVKSGVEHVINAQMTLVDYEKVFKEQDNERH